jgi:hypothetical protein
MGAKPVDGGHAPPVAGHKARESVLRHRRRQIIANPTLMFEEFGGDHRTDRVTAKVFRSRRAAAVSIETRHGVIAARLQRTTKDISVCHRSSIAEVRTRVRVEMLTPVQRPIEA